MFDGCFQEQKINSLFDFFRGVEHTVWFDIGWLLFFAIPLADDAKMNDTKRRTQAGLSNSERLSGWFRHCGHSRYADLDMDHLTFLRYRAAW
jgi:hypothetical protein